MKTFFNVSPRLGESELFKHYGYKEVSDIEKASIILFSGGEDITPTIYGQKKHPSTHPNKKRDLFEINAYYASLFSEKKNLRFGICRGFQLIAALNGSVLYQDIVGHRHNTHKVFSNNKAAFEVNSIHHQAVAHIEGEALLWSIDKSNETVPPLLRPLRSAADEIIEAAYWNVSNSFGVQWHPEMMSYNSEATKWIFNKIEEYLCAD